MLKPLLRWLHRCLAGHGHKLGHCGVVPACGLQISRGCQRERISCTHHPRHAHQDSSREQLSPGLSRYVVSVVDVVRRPARR